MYTSKWFRNALTLMLASLIYFGLAFSAQACSDSLIDAKLIAPAMEQYLAKLRKQDWEGIQPFGSLEGERIYLTPAFEQLKFRQKKQVLELLLLGYGEYRPLMQLMTPESRRRLRESGGTMLPYTVYTSDGRVVSVPYNGCNRMLVLTEYERSRLGFLGIHLQRQQRYPMSRWQQEQIKKLFWNTVGYELAGDYWIAWVPESGHFEIDVPHQNYERVLEHFWKVAPTYYRYIVMENGTRRYTYFRGKRSAG